MKIGFVCTNYNNSSFTRAAIASLRTGSLNDTVHVVVVDNQSREADVAALRAFVDEYPGVELIANPKNLGYFPGLNVGIRHLRASRPEVSHIVVGNNDLTFPADFAETLCRCRDVFDAWPVVAPDIVRGDGMHQNPHAIHPIGWMRRVIWDIYFSSYGLAIVIKNAARVTRRFTARPETLPGASWYRTARPIELGFGACYILGPAFFAEFSSLFAPTFLMEEEFFLAEQVRSIGRAVYYDPRFVVLHHDHATTDQLPSLRHWKISQEAHRIYKRYLALSRSERGDLIRRETTPPFWPPAVGEF